MCCSAVVPMSPGVPEGLVRLLSGGARGGQQGDVDYVNPNYDGECKMLQTE